MNTPATDRAVEWGPVDGYRRVTVYVAGATARGVPLAAGEHQRWVRRAADALATLTGGAATVHPADTGYWRGVTEPTVRVEALVAEAVWFGGGRCAVERFARAYATGACQETVLVTAEPVAADAVWFISPPDGGGVVADE